ncbi:MAG: NTP transferase domain-containing protein [Methanolobus sp.]
MEVCAFRFKRACGKYVFTVACDMPFLNSQLIDMMFDMVGEHDALIPVSEHGKKEPLHAIYNKDVMLEAVELSLDEGRRSILAPVSLLDDVLYLDADAIKAVDKDFKSFVNINTPSDMIKLDNWDLKNR